MKIKLLKELIIRVLGQDGVNELFVSIYEDERNNERQILCQLEMESTENSMFTMVVHGVVNLMKNHGLGLQLILDNIFHQTALIPTISSEDKDE